MPLHERAEARLPVPRHRRHGQPRKIRCGPGPLSVRRLHGRPERGCPPGSGKTPQEWPITQRKNPPWPTGRDGGREREGMPGPNSVRQDHQWSTGASSYPDSCITELHPSDVRPVCGRLGTAADPGYRHRSRGAAAHGSPTSGADRNSLLCAIGLQASSTTPSMLRDPTFRSGPKSGRPETEDIGALGRIRTPDPLIRSQVLYPAELPAHAA